MADGLETITKMKIRTWCDSGANSQSSFEDEFEIDEEEWRAMTDDEKDAYAKEVAFGRLDWGWKVEKAP